MKLEKADLGWWQQKEEKQQEQVEKQRVLFILIWLYALDRSLSLIKILKISQTGYFRRNVYHLGCCFENIWIVIKYHGFQVNV